MALVGPNGAGKSTLLKLLMGEVRHLYHQLRPTPSWFQSDEVYSLVSVAPTYWWYDPQTFSCQDWQISPGKTNLLNILHRLHLIHGVRHWRWLVQLKINVWVFKLFSIAPDWAAWAGLVSFGVHDEVFPWDQRKGGDAEDHRSLWSNWETAGRKGILSQNYY